MATLGCALRDVHWIPVSIQVVVSIVFVFRTRLTLHWWCHICKWSFNNEKKITWSSIESLSLYNFWSLGADLLVPPNKEDFFHLREFFKASIMYLLVIYRWRAFEEAGRAIVGSWYFFHFLVPKPFETFLKLTQVEALKRDNDGLNSLKK